MTARDPAGSASDEVYRHLKEQIVSGRLAGGELISEGTIADALGRSRTPVREAFLRLEAEGWMQLYPKRGAMVVPITTEARRHIVEARRAVEITAATTIIERGVPQPLIDTLRALIDLQCDPQTRDDAGTFASADADFHRAIVHALGNPFLADFYDSLRERQRCITAAVVGIDPHRLSRTVEGHRALAAALENHDAAAFAAAIDEHLTRLTNLF